MDESFIAYSKLTPGTKSSLQIQYNSTMKKYYVTEYRQGNPVGMGNGGNYKISGFLKSMKTAFRWIKQRYNVTLMYWKTPEWGKNHTKWVDHKCKGISYPAYLNS